MKLLRSNLLLLPLLPFLVSLDPAPTAAREFNPDNPLNTPPPIYWCPHRTPDQQIAAAQEPGCKPLVEKEEEQALVTAAERRGKKTEDKPLIKIHEIQNAASKFAQRYREFLDCCATDVDSIEDIEELQEQAVHILKSVLQKGIFNSAGFGVGAGSSGLGGGPGTSPKLGTFARQWTISEIVRTVAMARDDLSRLKKRLEQLGEAKERVDTLDYEAAARERRRIEEEEESIAKEFRARRPPPSARTGMEIESTTLPTRIGGEIESTTLHNSFGADIGYTVSPYSNVREDLHPRRGPEIQNTDIPTRYGSGIGGGNTPPTTLPNSTGFEIGTEQGPTGPSTLPSRAGPFIGDSSLNQR